MVLSVQWARDEFEGLFKQPPENAMQYLTYVAFPCLMQSPVSILLAYMLGSFHRRNSSLIKLLFISGQNSSLSLISVCGLLVIQYL